MKCHFTANDVSHRDGKKLDQIIHETFIEKKY